MGLWKYWASDIAKIGLHGFFTQESWTDYLPFYFYFLFILGKISIAFNITGDLLYKIPAILADLGTGVIIYLILDKLSTKKRLLLTSLYIFNPAVFANSAMWGQVDSLGGFLILISLYLFLKKRVILMGVFLAMSVLFKPLYLIALPIFLLAQFKAKPRQLPNFISSLAISTFLITLPFSTNILDTPQLMFDRYTASLNQYHYASVNAFNFWAAVGKNWTADETLFLGVPYHLWGLLLFGSFFLLLLLNLLFEKFNEKNVMTIMAATIALSFMCIFTFPTRVHERHLFTIFPILVLLFNENIIFKSSYLILSLLYLLNLYFGIKYLYVGFVFSNPIVQIISAILTIVCTLLTIYTIFIFKPAKAIE